MSDPMDDPLRGASRFAHIGVHGPVARMYDRIADELDRARLQNDRVDALQRRFTIMCCAIGAWAVLDAARVIIQALR